MLVHVGRQPILDADRAVRGYELLFRAHSDAVVARVPDPELATARVLVTTFLDMGLPDLVGDALAFVNMPRGFLVGEVPLPFGPDGVVLEVLEDVPADPEVLAGVRALAELGYTLALDDVTVDDPRRPLLDLVDYVKLDLASLPAGGLAALVEPWSGGGRTLIAEKVETEEQFAACRALGVELFQGNLFSRARTLTAGTLAPSQLGCLQLVSLLGDPDVPIERLVAVLERDPGLALRVLRASNNAAAGLPQRVGSVQQAVVLLGRRSLQSWVLLMTLAASPAGAEAVGDALSRARMCELLAAGVPGADLPSAFLVGLLSGMAEPLGLPLPVLARQLPLADPVLDALIARAGPLGVVLESARAYEAGRVLPHVDEEAARRAYLGGLVWSQRTRSAARSA